MPVSSQGYAWRELWVITDQTLNKMLAGGKQAGGLAREIIQKIQDWARFSPTEEAEEDIQDQSSGEADQNRSRAGNRVKITNLLLGTTFLRSPGDLEHFSGYGRGQTNGSKKLWGNHTTFKINVLVKQD
ncbi:hypothetical protein DSO57_1024453 [Entomophthora muscae]|uniref:Uncharacterized protein n=1 Tax=Entomophthora muscae TaxID=34485 RepID=A0ACC2S4J6_9FUNG|nr:hypothetical protein DSO57_1024453 [Entomophthora muscae]